MGEFGYFWLLNGKIWLCFKLSLIFEKVNSLLFNTFKHFKF